MTASLQVIDVIIAHQSDHITIKLKKLFAEKTIFTLSCTPPSLTFSHLLL